MMLVLRFTCRLLLAAAAVMDVRAAPFQAAESALPAACFLSCQGGRHRAVCGTNGRLYKSVCAFQRARCFNTGLRPAARRRCSAPALSRCQLARRRAREAQRSGAAAVFVPRCRPDGHFLPLQCHDWTGYCWCSTPDGQPVSGSSVLHLVPNCTDLMTKFTDGDSALARGVKGPDESAEPVTTVTPRRLAVLTAPPLWATIQMNSDPAGSRSARREPGGSRPCEHERASLLSQPRSARQPAERFFPECSADGRYRPAQCHAATGYCWCVAVDSGRPLAGTSLRYRIPECSGPDEPPTRPRDREEPLPGCPGAREKLFLRSLVRALQQEAEPAGSLSSDATVSTSSSTSSSTPVSSSTTTTTSSSSSSTSAPSISPSTSSFPPSSSSSYIFTPPPSSSPSTAVDVASSPPVLRHSEDSSAPEVALRWHFVQLDVDSSGVLSEREARPLRHFLRRRLRPRRCAKKFLQHCDGDGDRGLTLEELTACLLV